jgi:hypothetical protein
VRITGIRARWLLCFVALPTLWIAVSAVTDFQAVQMIPLAIALGAVSALTAYRSGRGLQGAIAYVLGTAAMMGVAFGIAVAIIFSTCGGEDC